MTNGKFCSNSFRSFTQPGLNSSRSTALVRIPPNDSPHGQIRWAPNSLRVVVNEAEKDVDSSKLVTLEMIREQGTLGNIEVEVILFCWNKK